ncbi:hypothetical protein IEO70_14020 [Bacillus sp. AGMB 02131]|uniref:Uncharacterized protein n=1 Tax=Peribacillus faecalis TaxID=2772559 RepID=A0A927HCE2_9BACI|nr:hypothetical protein [Peribacillus faecalis]MBD3109461.1 hypothetical protein [Peribacillus faecalis]
MQASGIASSIIPQHSAHNSIELKDGQMLYGKVLKIHTNQTAEISIGQHKITAQLDAPIAAGGRYWFQVQATGEQTMLKVMPGNGNNQSLKDLSLQLLQHFSLPQTRESLSLALFMVKNQLPFTKEQFIQSLQWLGGSGNQMKNMPFLKVMHDFSLPFSEQVFRSLASFDDGIPLQKLFIGLNSLLFAPKNETEASVKALLTQFLMTDTEKLAERGLQKLLTYWLNPGGNQKQQASSILKAIGFFPKNESVFLQQAMKQIGESSFLNGNQNVSKMISFLNQFQTSGVVPNAEQLGIQMRPSSLMGGETTLWNQLQKAAMQFSKAAAAINIAGKSTDNGNALQTAYQQLARAIIAFIGAESSNSPVKLNRFMQILHQSMQLPAGFEQIRSNMTAMIGQVAEGKPLHGLSADANQFFHQLMQTEINDLAVPKSSVIANEIKQLIRQFGFGFENYLASADKGRPIKETELITLKPLLLQLVNETQQQAVREQADQLIHKITAQQILSQSSGPMQHFVSQIPLSFHGFHTEAVMQWSGRKDENDQIDPAFCRVLFYLQLSNLDETVIDMVVQNRVLKVTVINEHYKELKAAAGPLIEQAKENLAHLGYQVSGFSFIPPSGKNVVVKSKTEVLDKAPYAGLDIKI